MKVIVLNKPIGFWGADDLWLNDELNAANGEDVEIWISSPGGLVTKGIAMSNLAKHYSGKVTMRVIGMAASMASYFALSGDGKPIVEDDAIFHYHNAVGPVVGDYREMAKAADYLNKVTGVMARRYSKISGKSITEIRAGMDEEVILFGKDIVKAGFAREVVKAKKPETREDATAYATIAIKDIISKIRSDATIKEDWGAAAALLPGEPEPKKLKNPAAVDTGKNKTEDAMDLAKLKAELPALYNEILQAGEVAGVEKERNRVKAHITLAKPAAAHEICFKHIESGASITDEVIQAEYLAAGITTQSVAARTEDDPGDVQIDPATAAAETKAHMDAFDLSLAENMDTTGGLI